MKTKLIIALIVLGITSGATAQRNCVTADYQQRELQKTPGLSANLNAIEKFTQQQIISANQSREAQGIVIKIPVVVHVLYHLPHQNISDAQIHSQIAALNRDFRRRAADTSNTPAVFRSLAADVEIEFQLAISDPMRRYTTGIIRKYTPINEWDANDKMKFSSETGSDAWDTKQYLNIWVCSLDQVVGYSSVPGGPDNVDGVVIAYNAFGTINTMAGYNMGKTAVHEIGHWLNLKHLWGDSDCGDDLVGDTPKQSTYTVGCPSGTRISCSNAPYGNMYTNYMDFTEDACMNLFTHGQKARMRAMFAAGGPRNKILTSVGLSTPLIFESPLPEEPPKWLHAKFFPNPATTQITLDMSYDVRWVGKSISVSNLQGQTVMQVVVTSKVQTIDISRLQPGMYFFAAKREDGERFKGKFIKL
jgi:hypothetical protein